MFAKVPYLHILAVSLLPHIVSTQHTPNFHPASLLVWKTFQPTSGRYATHIKLGHSSIPKAVVPLQTYACMFLNIYVIKTPQTHSPIINGMAKFLAQSLRPCWMLGGLPPSITVWGVDIHWGLVLYEWSSIGIFCFFYSGDANFNEICHKIRTLFDFKVWMISLWFI